VRVTFFVFVKACILTAGLFSLICCQTAAVHAQSTPEAFQKLEKRLINDEYDAALITKIFDNTALEFDIKGVSSYFRHRESTLNYDQFLSRKSIESARDYLNAHQKILSKIEAAYGVDKTVITAIILVETRLGTYVGDRSVLNTLATMAALEDPDGRKRFWQNLPDDVDISRERFEKKAAQKSKWAYRELKAFIEHIDKEALDPHTVLGSYAGALGIAQFMPSNIAVYARDGNDDGRINLFDHGDAIASIANYLKKHGWEPGLEKEKAEKVIYRYNHSSYYVDTILAISEKLKG